MCGRRTLFSRRRRVEGGPELSVCCVGCVLSVSVLLCLLPPLLCCMSSLLFIQQEFVCLVRARPRAEVLAASVFACFVS